MALFRRRRDELDPGLLEDDRPRPAGIRARGPYDESEVSGIGDRLDLGGIWLPGVAGMQIRLELEPGTERVIGVNCMVGESALQMQAYAAPRSSGIWGEIQEGIAGTIQTQGGTVETLEGPLGEELRTRMPVPGADGRVTWASVRFLGVDGPRWFLRAVLSGPAAVDDEHAAPLIGIVRDVVVVRGDEAMAPRELIPLTLPRMASDGQPGAIARPVEEP